MTALSLHVINRIFYAQNRENRKNRETQADKLQTKDRSRSPRHKSVLVATHINASHPKVTNHIFDETHSG